MKTVRLYILLFFIVLYVPANAAHMVGYDMYLVNIKNSNGIPTDNYKWVLKFYKDANNLTPAPLAISFELRNQTTNALVGLFSCNKINPLTVVNYLPGDCAPSAANSSLELGVYESPAINFSTLNNLSGYYVISTYCCKPTNLKNILDPNIAYGFVMTMDIPRLDIGSPTEHNSSPEFKKVPLTKYCIGKPYTIDWQIEDPDGDSLAFQLKESFADDINTVKPFNIIPFGTGYGLTTNIIDGAPDLTFNPTTGIINFRPTQFGNYTIQFKVDEYRKINGVPTKIGTIYRDFIITMVDCNEIPPSLTDNKKRSNLIKDTVYVNHTATYQNEFNGKEQIGDSIFMQLISAKGAFQNILDSTKFNVMWGQQGGQTYSANAIENVTLASKDSIKTSFVWELDSTDIKKTPYQFKFITFDKTCGKPLADTLNVELSVLGQCTNTNQVNLVACDSVIDLLGRKHFSSVIVVDTILASIGCDTIFTQHITVLNTPKAYPIIGDTTITNTSISYFYNTTAQQGVDYHWTVQNGTIVSGQGTNVVEITWQFNTTGTLNCTVVEKQRICTDSSTTTFNIAILTGTNNIQVSTIKIYPNPAQHIVYVEGLSTKETTLVELYDVQGKLIFTKEIAEKGSIDLSTLSKGIYLIKIAELVQRVVKM